MSDTAPAPFRRPEGRYGRPRSSSRLTALVLSGLLTAFAIAVAVLGWQLSHPEISVQVRAYDVVDDRRVEVTYLVRREDGTDAARCILRARDYDGNEVGRTTVDVPPGAREVVLTGSITTTARAITGEVQECSIQ